MLETLLINTLITVDTRFLDSNGKYSATATPGGRGQGAFVTIVKNKSYYEKQNRYLLNLKKSADNFKQKLQTLGLDSSENFGSSAPAPKMLVDENECKQQDVIDLTDL